MQCEKCGTEQVNPSAQFCSVCGSQFPGAAALDAFASLAPIAPPPPGAGPAAYVPLAPVPAAPIAQMPVMQMPVAQIPIAQKINGGLQVAVCILGLVAALIFLVTGIKLAGLSSVSGNTIAEAYYQGIGWALIGVSSLTVAVTVYCAKRLAALKK